MKATSLAKWKFKREWLWLILAAMIGAAIAHYTETLLKKVDKEITE